MICGEELFGPEFKGTTAVIVCALYGLKSASAAWRDHCASVIRDDLKFKACLADNDMYFKPKVKQDGTLYYSYLIIYVDDIICIDIDPIQEMNAIGRIFQIKEGSVSKPKLYLGADVRGWEYQGSDGTLSNCYAIGSNSYLKEALKNVKALVKKHNLEFPTSKRHTGAPFSNTMYRAMLKGMNKYLFSTYVCTCVS